ncbi:MAG: polysaccharide export protein [Alphaproteobacteria bacterium]|nr:polysaccharide export protein [Alphaproteobacteria bacterium]
MGRSALVFLRLSMIGGALAILVFCVRAASAQEYAHPVATQPAQPERYGFMPVQNAAPDAQPYGIKPIPGYTPPPAPAAPTAAAPPQMLRGSFEEQKAAPAPDGEPSAYGYVPLRDASPARPMPQPARIANAPMPVQDDAARVNADYRLGPGDKIRVTVFGESDLSGEYQVDGSGLVRLPLIGTLRASGMTAPALEQDISAAFADGYLKSPRVNVEISTYRPFYIIGAVNRPGQYAYIDHMSALNAVALAGGFTDQAIQSTLYVRHEGSAREEAVPASQLAHIAPGDVIRVKTSIFWEAMNMFAPVAGPAAIAAAAIN